MLCICERRPPDSIEWRRFFSNVPRHSGRTRLSYLHFLLVLFLVDDVAYARRLCLCCTGLGSPLQPPSQSHGETTFSVNHLLDVGGDCNTHCIDGSHISVANRTQRRQSVLG